MKGSNNLLSVSQQHRMPIDKLIDRKRLVVNRMKYIEYDLVRNNRLKNCPNVCNPNICTTIRSWKVWYKNKFLDLHKLSYIFALYFVHDFIHLFVDIKWMCLRMFVYDKILISMVFFFGKQK